jgi:hypothetical protein
MLCMISLSSSYSLKDCDQIWRKKVCLNWSESLDFLNSLLCLNLTLQFFSFFFYYTFLCKFLAIARGIRDVRMNFNLTWWIESLWKLFNWNVIDETRMSCCSIIDCFVRRTECLFLYSWRYIELSITQYNTTTLKNIHTK